MPYDIPNQLRFSRHGRCYLNNRVKIDNYYFLLLFFYFKNFDVLWKTRHYF